MMAQYKVHLQLCKKAVREAFSVGVGTRQEAEGRSQEAEVRRQKSGGKKVVDSREQGLYSKLFKRFELVNYCRDAVLAFMIGFASLGWLPVMAQSEKPNNFGQNPASNLSEPLIFKTPPPPPDIGKPQTTTGGGSRGECDFEGEPKQLTETEKQGLTALVPSSGWGLTTSAHPTFWFYVSDSRQLPAEFVLQDEATEETIYQTPLTVTGTPGVISISLPSTVAPLEIGKRYRWGIELLCNPQKTIFVEGLVQRVELSPDLKSQLKKATPQQRLALYAKEGFWYDALMVASELYRIDSQNANWATLLNNVGLDAIATQPLVDCCEIQNSK
jgi:hypothetical protein